MTVIEAFRNFLSEYELHKILERSEIVSGISQKCCINESSIIPSDYCYNITNDAFLGDQYMKRPHFFLSLERGKYEYIGENADYTGDVINSKGSAVCHWNNGKCEIAEDHVKHKYSVTTAVWLATAKLTYEAYYRVANPTISDIYITAKDIHDLAQTYCDQNVDMARIYQWCNADHQNNTYNYIRVTDVGGYKMRRLISPGEKEGKKERPEDIQHNDFITLNGKNSTMLELLHFIDHEYKSLIQSDVISNGTNIDSLAILKFLDEHANEPYTKPDRVKDESEKEKIIKLADAGRVAADEFEKLLQECSVFTDYKLFHNKTWLDGSNVKTRRYFWGELKKSGYESSPISISIFAENVTKDGARFRFSIELKEKSATEEDYKKQNSLLEMDLRSTDIPLQFLSGGNNDGSLQELGTDVNQILSLLQKKQFRKVQLCSVLTRKDILEYEYGDNITINFMKNAIKELEPFYMKVIGADLSVNNKATLEVPGKVNENINEKVILYDRNLILSGPPGTGKTYHSVIYTVAICDSVNLEAVKNKPYSDVLARYNELRTDGRVAFTTFHQSYGYEEFIEGIRPVITKNSDEDSCEVKYEYADGAFKKFCLKASDVKVQATELEITENPTVWNVLLDGAGESELKKRCFANNYIKIGWSQSDENITEQTPELTDKARRILLNFQEEMQIGDIVFTQRSNTTIDGIGVITGQYQFNDKDEFPRTREVRWIATGIDENVLSMNKNVKLDRKSTYPLTKMEITDVMSLIKKYSESPEVIVEKNQKPYVFVIDEINRGNISKIFGELITLIEPTKRIGAEEAMTATLPYTGDEFGVPDNVYLLGTMNTADRSIEPMDTALRRRFQFVEMMPETEVLTNIGANIVKSDDGSKEIDIVNMLRVINERIEYLFDREHTIGHAFFTGLKDNPTIDKLADIFKKSVVPLLQEYFYEDYSKIQLVLGDNNKSDDRFKFILDTHLKVKEIFNGNPDIDLPEKKYKIQETAFHELESYMEISYHK